MRRLLALALPIALVACANSPTPQLTVSEKLEPCRGPLPAADLMAPPKAPVALENPVPSDDALDRVFGVNTEAAADNGVQAIGLQRWASEICGGAR